MCMDFRVLTGWWGTVSFGLITRVALPNFILGYDPEAVCAVRSQSDLHLSDVSINVLLFLPRVTIAMLLLLHLNIES